MNNLYELKTSRIVQNSALGLAVIASPEAIETTGYFTKTLYKLVLCNELKESSTRRKRLH